MKRPVLYLLTTSALFLAAGVWLAGFLPGHFADYEAGRDRLTTNTLVRTLYQLAGGPATTALIAGLMFVCAGLSLIPLWTRRRARLRAGQSR